MNDPLIIILFISFIVGSLLYARFFSRKAKLKRKIHGHKERTIASVQEGELVKIKGRVVLLGKTLTAPLSGRRCSYYHVIVEEQDGKHRRERINEEVGGEIIIEDGGHYAMISTKVAHTFIDQDEKYDSGFLQDATEPLEKYLRRHGEKSVGFLGFNKSLEYKEGVLEEGETIIVSGKANWVSRSKLRINVPVERVLLITADGEDNPVRFSDDVDIVEA